jgi:hypothetical protein
MNRWDEVKSISIWDELHGGQLLAQSDKEFIESPFKKRQDDTIWTLCRIVLELMEKVEKLEKASKATNVVLDPLPLKGVQDVD